MKTITVQNLFDTLDLQAKVIMATQFSGMMTSLRFEMHENRPSDEMQRALDTLVRYGAISVQVENNLIGSLVYRPILKREATKVFREWLDSFNGDWPEEARFSMITPVDPSELDSEKTLRDREREIRRLAKLGEMYNHPITQRVQMLHEHMVVNPLTPTSSFSRTTCPFSYGTEPMNKTMHRVALNVIRAQYTNNATFDPMQDRIRLAITRVEYPRRTGEFPTVHDLLGAYLDHSNSREALARLHHEFPSSSRVSRARTIADAFLELVNHDTQPDPEEDNKLRALSVAHVGIDPGPLTAITRTMLRVRFWYELSGIQPRLPSIRNSFRCYLMLNDKESQYAG